MDWKRDRRWALAAAGLAALAACEEPELVVPSAATVEAYYTIPAHTEFEMNGNVAEITVVQPDDQLRRGGTIWAKVGPYIYLFSEPTQRAFFEHPGLAAVRVVTESPGGTEVARALLHRDALNGLTWKRALNISGRARLEGGERVSRLEDLIRWGEDHTEHEYNPRYVRHR